MSKLTISVQVQVEVEIHEDADLITVTLPDGRSDTTQLAGSAECPESLASVMAGQLLRTRCVA